MAMPTVALALTGMRVLIVEDEYLVAMIAESFLKEFGCSTLGPYGTLAEALEVARTETFDLAVLDINLHGEKVFPVANVLGDRQIPFLFVSGYGDEALPAGYRDKKICAKPFSSDVFACMLEAVVVGSILKPSVTPPAAERPRPNAMWG
jgi:DNA-binding response OmpR family regulator